MTTVRIDKLVIRHWTEHDRTYNDDSLEDMKGWCEKNCYGGWEYDSYYDVFIWYFEIEEDAMAFKLRWG